MGALIATKGTRRLIKALNSAFDKGSISATKTSIAGDAALLQLFNTPSGTAPIIQSICNNATGKQLFLPPQDDNNHKNLLKRWKFFLGNELSNPNHELIRKFIWQVINGPSGLTGPNAKNSKGDVFAAIRFDCVEGNIQTVLASDEYRLKGNDDDDTGLVKSTAFLKIVLITAPTANTTDPLDPQF
jgi:hypothetical protein